MSYKGPNVSVTQTFTPTPASISVEKNPPLIVGVAYDVYKSNVGSFSGCVGASTNMPWTYLGAPVADVVWDKTAGRKYDFFPVAVTATSGVDSSLLTEGEDYTVSEDGVSVNKSSAYTLSSIGADQGLQLTCLKVDQSDITFTDGVTVSFNATNVSLAKNGIRKGLPVMSGSSLAYIKSVTSSNTIVLSAHITGVDTVPLFIGFSPAADGTTPMPAAITRVKGAFSGAVTGDVVRFTVAGHPETAGSIKSIESDLIVFNVKTVAKPISISENLAASTPVAAVSSQMVTSAKLERLVGFQAFIKSASGTMSADGLVFTATSPSQFDSVNAGDLISHAGKQSVITAIQSGVAVLDTPLIITPTYTPAVVTSANLFVDSVLLRNVLGTLDSTGLIFTATAGEGVATGFDTGIRTVHIGSKQATVTTVVGQVITVASNLNTLVQNDVSVDTYRVNRSSQIIVDFRAVNSDNAGSIQRIDNTKLINTLFAKGREISPCNELAFMTRAAATLAGGVVYAANIGKVEDEVSAYQAILEDSSLIEIYDICFGTTSGAVNAILPAHVNAMADPYEGKERIAVTSYDDLDVFKLAESSASYAPDGHLTGFSFMANMVGIKIGDTVKVFSSDLSEFITTSVVLTPIDSGVIHVATGLVWANGDVVTGDVVVEIRTNDKYTQATKISGIGSAGNRRITAIWPSWFQADGSDGVTRSFPPYYIASAIAGNDSGYVASQSFTNLNYGIPGLSNISLNTNFNYRKDMLDIIGGGGVDIQIQDASVSPTTIKSRHDLATDMSSVEFRERSVTKQVDGVAKAYRAATNPFIGQYNINGPAGEKLIGFLQKVSSILSSALIQAKTCAGCQLNSITRDTDVADKLNWDVSVTVYIAGNYYAINLNVLSR